MAYLCPVIHHLRIALVASRKSLAEATAAADEVKAHLGSSNGCTSKGLGSRVRPGEVVDDGIIGKDGDRPVKSKAEVNLVYMIVDGGVSNLAGLFNAG